jgi:hypothetical protein
LSATSDPKIRANRANARASTGPKTKHGRTRSARNALRHALSLSVYSEAALAEEVAALAREIAGMNTNAEMQELARRVAEAQIDLHRVRVARHQLLSRALSNASDALADAREESAAEDAADVPLTGPVKRRNFAKILPEHVQRLSVMDRYERRALSRRKFAIRAFDSVKTRNNCN